MKKRDIKIKRKIGFNPKNIHRNRKMNRNNKINEIKKIKKRKSTNWIIKISPNKRISRNRTDKKLYVWLLLGVLFFLGIGMALLALIHPKQEEEPVEDKTGPSLPETAAQEEAQGNGQKEEQGKTQEEEQGKAREEKKEKEQGKVQEEEREKAQGEAQEEEQEKEQGKAQEKEQEKQQESKAKRLAGVVGGALYLLLILGVCIVPLLLFEIRPTETTAENRTMAALPEIWTAEGFNWNVLSEAGAYFTDRFSFRQEMVSINAGIRSEIFGVSPVEDVIVGENGWLYYAATLDDYQHKNSISERMLFNIAHNTALMQEYTEGLGKTFVFTIAPNKNSLYGGNMPGRLRYQVAEKSDAQRLLPWLVSENINYVDLFALFEEQEETLYYARDSHWNEKGAVMVYNALLDVSGKQHETYEGAQPMQQTDYFGDLGVMLFPVGGRPEVRLQYPVGDTWRYVEGEEAEDQFIRTVNENGEGNLLMYRDSFGNSLLPYMAQTFAQTVFSRQVPYPMSDLVTYEPDILIVEKVERQLPTLGKVPPMMSAPIRQTEKAFAAAESTSATVSLSREGSYWKLEGLTDPACMDSDSRIYVEVEDGSGPKLYEAFCVSSTAAEDGGTNDYGYLLYVSETQVSGDTFRIRVMTEREESMLVLLTGELCALQDRPAKMDQEAGEDEKEEKTPAVTQPVKDQTTSGTQVIEEQTGPGTQAGQGQEKPETQVTQDQEKPGAQGTQSQTGEGTQTGQGRKKPVTQGTQGQAGEGTQTGQGQKKPATQGTQGQAVPEPQTSQGQTVPEPQTSQDQTGPGAQVTEGQTGAGVQEAESQTGTGAQAASDQTTSETQMSQAQKEAQAQAEAQAQKASETQTQTAVQQHGQQAVTEVGRVYMEDCGSDSGYWVITYSDGHVEYVDD